MSELESRLTRNLEAARVRPSDTLVLACSGGVDSMTLLYALACTRPAETLVVAHANHGLRGLASDEDEAFVRDHCTRLGIRFETVCLPVTAFTRESGKSLEESGRILRYEFFETVRADYLAVAILTAHHADDLAETLLYRLARGTGLRGLRGIEPVRGYLIRPFLDCSRSEIEKYAKEQGVEYREDASNADTVFARNMLRHEVMPKLASINAEYVRSFGRFARYAADCADFLDDSVRDFLGSDDFFSIGKFQKKSDFLQREIIRYLYEIKNNSTVGLSEANIWEIMRFIYNGWNPTEKTLGKLRLYKTGDRVYHCNFPPSKILSMSEKSIFTRIIEGEIPCYKVYEDELVIAFLDINPITLGHTLIVPKTQIDEFQEVPEPYASALFAAAQKIAKALKLVTGRTRVGMVIAGFDVPHTHLHLIPANETADMNFSHAHKEDDTQMKEILEKIKNHL